MMAGKKKKSLPNLGRPFQMGFWEIDFQKTIRLFIWSLTCSIILLSSSPVMAGMKVDNSFRDMIKGAVINNDIDLLIELKLLINESEKSKFYDWTIAMAFVEENKKIINYALVGGITQEGIEHSLEGTIYHKKKEMFQFGQKLWPEQAKAFLEKEYQNTANDAANEPEYFIERLKTVLEFGADPNFVPEPLAIRGKTYLCGPMLFWARNPQIMQIMLDYGADPDLKNCKGESLEEAYPRESKELVKALAEYRKAHPRKAK